MKRFLFIFILFSGICLSQETDKFAFELKGNTLTGMGSNFTGFGVGFTGTFLKNIGLGIEFNKSYSEVSDVSVFGDLHSPQFTTFDYYALYRYQANNRLSFEGNIGGGYAKLKSYSNYRTKNFSESGNAFLVGAKAMYGLTKNNNLQLVVGPRFYFLSTFTEMNDPKIEKYYSKSTLLILSLGLRICF
ncbi:hypothetical protein [Kaistella sp.]|uniref:hypothetical protein n=1 Tax=Kaistella sp. TaxID=2782235 RepID=UPI002F9227CE